MSDPKHRIESIKINGFKSIDTHGQTLSLDRVNILLGANGVGKTNIISFFEMLRAITLQNFQNYVRSNDGANNFLHYGVKKTHACSFEILFHEDSYKRKYQFELSSKVGDELFFSKEILDYSDDVLSGQKHLSSQNSSLESAFFNKNIYDTKNSLSSIEFLNNFRIYQFSDTSKSSNIRSSVYIEDGKELHSDGGNLAAFLFAMKNQKETNKYYQRIVKYIKLAMPQFHDFELQLSTINSKNILLNWYENNSEHLFGPHQISDGSLRFMALASLLLQQPKTLPSVIVLDEPELGLHPTAISLLASMIKTASQHCQIVLATQSTNLIDEFEPKNIIIMERQKDRSILKQLNYNELEDWLQRYSISEIWEKNIIGGRP